MIYPIDKKYPFEVCISDSKNQAHCQNCDQDVSVSVNIMGYWIGILCCLTVAANCGIYRMTLGLMINEE